MPSSLLIYQHQSQNAFSRHLSRFLDNFFELFVPDFLHEWELGVWKNLLIHLIRILYALKDGKVHEFNERWVPPRILHFSPG